MTSTELEPSNTIDLRSDTVTRPSIAMRRAMAEAEVGDDVYGEDPTVNRLQARAAEIFEREAALFVPSGCMGNLLAVKTWARPGSEVICEQRGHINNFELASMSAIAGCIPRTAAAPDGILAWDLVEPLIRPHNYYTSPTALVVLENTSNMHGGTVYSRTQTEAICQAAHAAGLKVHLDGARIFNAAVALGCHVADLTRKCDSAMFCFSKGLGAPVGSMLLGSREFIELAHTTRKMVGGGMRQAGVLAAAALVALEQSPQRLYIDHENAQVLAKGLAKIHGLKIDPAKFPTNILIVDVSPSGHTAAEVCAELKRHRVLASPTGKQTIRMVTHCDIDRGSVERAIEGARAALSGLIKHPVNE